MEGSKWRWAKFKNSHLATVPRFSTIQNPKMVMMVPCDENPHIIYYWKEHEEENIMR
jgi:hypothetical protein